VDLATAEPASNPKKVLIALQGEGLLGFACAFGNYDAVWGTLLDNLHVAAAHQRTGVGMKLLQARLQWSAEAHAARGGQIVGEDLWDPPGGGKLVPRFRVAWLN
jgi:GNAT superfamily N-acetyltransferase